MVSFCICFTIPKEENAILFFLPRFPFYPLYGLLSDNVYILSQIRIYYGHNARWRKNEMEFGKVKAWLGARKLALMGLAATGLAWGASAAINLSAISEVITAIVDIVPDLIDLVVGVVPIIVVIALVGFIVAFFDKILAMLKM